MAKNDGVWGIDIGQCALKALRCRVHDDEDKVIADAFDYIEYPKILSQAGAEPEELIAEALKKFLSRNSLAGDRVAISVPGQSGLARFIKLPPVEAKKIPDIVRYEARQQIPFDLNDVIWDYQRMGGGSEEEGFALETEVGLFAMKRDAVFRSLEPLQKAGIAVDFVQLTPLALYNFLLFDQLRDLPAAEEYDPETPPDSVVVLSLGTDASDLVVTNGYRVWQRSIPLGGNHFTRALTKELKLTFAKAEHLKRNATAAQDPKAVFQAMRPVFSDLLTELQRSIGYFSSIDRNAEISHMVALGNAMKLPGLRRYLSQSLGYEVIRADEFRGLTGTEVTAAPAFKDNAPCFGVCYGLALQGLGKAGLKTNLLPREIVQDRMIRQKKPWAVAAAAILMLGCCISIAMYSLALGSVSKENWKAAEGAASGKVSEAGGLQSEMDAAKQEFLDVVATGENLLQNVEGQVLWLELLRAINACLPDPGPPVTSAEEIANRDELHIDNLECQYVEDLQPWYQHIHGGGDAAADPNAAFAPAAPAGGEGPTGAGWIVRLSGHHYHNFAGPGKVQGAEYVRKMLIEQLEDGNVTLPTANRDGVEEVLIEDLGIRYPELVKPGRPYDHALKNERAPKPRADGVAGAPEGSGEVVNVKRFDFEVQFCWIPVTPSERQKQREAEAAEEAAEEAANVDGGPGAPGTVN